jgi:hypothetical protein
MQLRLLFSFILLHVLLNGWQSTLLHEVSGALDGP